MKAEEVIIQDKYKELKNLSLICEAMEEYAETKTKSIERITALYEQERDNNQLFKRPYDILNDYKSLVAEQEVIIRELKQKLDD